MKKTATIILAIIGALTLVLSIATPNAELWNIPLEWITIGSTILLAVKQFIENSGMLTQEEANDRAISLTNYTLQNRINNPQINNLNESQVTHSEVENWKATE